MLPIGTYTLPLGNAYHDSNFLVICFFMGEHPSAFQVSWRATITIRRHSCDRIRHFGDDAATGTIRKTEI